MFVFSISIFLSTFISFLGQIIFIVDWKHAATSKRIVGNGKANYYQNWPSTEMKMLNCWSVLIARPHLRAIDMKVYVNQNEWPYAGDWQ